MNACGAVTFFWQFLHCTKSSCLSVSAKACQITDSFGMIPDKKEMFGGSKMGVLLSASKMGGGSSPQVGRERLRARERDRDMRETRERDLGVVVW